MDRDTKSDNAVRYPTFSVWERISMTRFCTLASGSSGNAALLSDGDTHILIDMGISCRRITQALGQLGISAEELSAVLITHEHTDHIAGLATYVKKYETPIVTTSVTARQLVYRIAGIEPRLRCVEWGETYEVGSVRITILPTSHDCSGSCAFRIETSCGAVGYITDTGYIPGETAGALLGTELLLLESNHDVEMLRSGPYPYHLKQRVLGMKGHLSNEVAATFALDSAKAGTKTIILAHLSAENNTPQVALNTVGRWLEAAGFEGDLSVAPRQEISRIFELG